MIILAIRTDKPEAELYLRSGSEQIGEIKWAAHRELSKTLHKKIDLLFASKSIKKAELGGLVIYAGPGSFTGLRIGFSVANALAYAHQIPVVATGGINWLKSGISKIESGEASVVALPNYGAPAITTTPKK